MNTQQFRYRYVVAICALLLLRFTPYGPEDHFAAVLFVALCFAHRFLCAAAIFARASSLRVLFRID